MRVAQVCELLGRSQEAENAWQEAIRILSGLTEEFPDDVSYQEDLADSLRGLAYRLLWLERPSAIRQTRHRQSAIREELVSQPARTLSHLRRLATCATGLGNTLKLAQPAGDSRQAATH